MDLPAAELALLLSQALNWHTDRAGKPVFFQIEPDSLQRCLYPDETLQNAGILKGGLLVLHPVASTHDQDVFRPGLRPQKVTPTPAAPSFPAGAGRKSQTPAPVRFNSPLSPPTVNPAHLSQTPAGVGGTLICSNCKQVLRSGSKFCGYCATPVKTA